MELCLPEEMGKGTGKLSCLEGAALFPCSEVQKGIRYNICFSTCTFSGFLSFFGVFARGVGLNCLDTAVPAFSNLHF